MTPEGRTKLRIKKLLHDSGVYFFMPVQMGYGMATVDVLGCRPRDGRMFAVEAKRHGAAPTERQKATLAYMAEKGVTCFVCDDEADDLVPRFDSLSTIKKWLTSDS